MLLRITLWSMLIGSAIMGYFGYQTGSTTTAIVGICAIVFGCFLLFFLAKLTLSAGLVFVKVVVIVLLLGSIILLGVRGCSIMWQKSKAAVTQATHHVKVSQEKIENDLSGKIETPSFMDKIAGYLSFKPKQKENLLPPPKDKQEKQQALVVNISGIVSNVLSGTSFILNGYPMKLYGVDAPDLNQACLTKRGEQYACGKTAQNKLKKLLLNKKIDCQIVGQDQNNFYLTTCVIQGYDVGATMVSVGWAVAERHISQVYIPYEQQAHRAHEGLWAGKFMAPWEFRERLQHSHNSQSGGLNAGNFFKGIFQ